MILRPGITIDKRDAAAILTELFARRPGYTPDWTPDPKDAAYVLSLIGSRFAQAIVQRLNQAPDKNKLAFFDTLGEQPSPARAARLPVVFELTPGVTGGLAPAGTGVAAPPPPGSNQQVVFETEKETGIGSGKLTQVFSFWPGRDEYIDHSADFAAGKAIMLFDREALQPVPHVLYLAHSVLLNLSGNVTLSVEFQLTRPAKGPLDIAWEYWDGQIWRGFAQLDPSCDSKPALSNDATNGLTSSGSVLLSADSAKGSQTTVNGLSAYWIRGRLDQTLPPDPSNPLPDVESIRLSSLVSRPLLAKLGGIARQPKKNVGLGKRGLLGEHVGPLSLILAPGTDPTEPREMKGTLVNEAGYPLPGATITISDPNDPAFGLRTIPTGAKGEFTVTLDEFGTAHALRFDVTFFSVTASMELRVPSNAAIVNLTLSIGGLVLDKAYNDGFKLDTSKPFQPFGAQPQPGTTFYFNNAETFVKPGAAFRLYLPKTSAPSDKLQPVDASGNVDPSITPLERTVVWEYWNGREWTGLSSAGEKPAAGDFTSSEILDFRVPLDMEPVEVNKDPDLWMRARLVSGGFGFTQTLTFNGTKLNVLMAQPPMLAAAAAAYSWQFGPFFPETVLTYNDFQYRDHTYEAKWPGSSFLPFQAPVDVTPALYLGFDQKPPTANIGIFFDLEESGAISDAAMVWEYWDGFEWYAVPHDDETGDLTAPGIFSYIAESDSERLARFGTPLYWLRGRWKEDGPPRTTKINGIFPNAVWARHQRTSNNVPLGKATGQPGEVFTVMQTPLIPGERLEVQELFGPRANVEWRLIAFDLSGGDQALVRKLEEEIGKEGPAVDIVHGDLRLKRDKQKRVSEVWVRWQAQPHLFVSLPADRHYAPARARGLIFFGNGVTGRVLPQDAQVQLQRFQSGGGTEGNVDARTVTQLLGAISGVQSVFNARAGEGGSDGETLTAFRDRAPASLRHRGRALTAADYEAMVREASSAVAVVKALPNRHPGGRILPGWLTVLIVPSSKAPRPYPSRGMREEVRAYLAERAPANLAASEQIYVTGPTYYPVDVYAVIVPVKESEAGSVEAAAEKAVAAFLHPLTGGPGGSGWDFGRGVYLSDVAVVLESVAGLDHAESIQLVVNSQVQGEAALVPANEIVVAGTVRFRVKGRAS